jgi:hypothetical protein
MPTRSPLYTAFSALYRHAPPAAQDRALRQAIAVLVSTHHPHAGPPGPVNASAGRWDQLRPQLRAAAAGPVGLRQVAQALGLAESTLSRMLTPHHTGPGTAILAKAEAWLTSRDSPTRASDAVSRPVSGNGAAPRDPPRRSGPNNKLSRAEREQLAGYLALDPAGVRQGAGVTAELAEKAVAGQDLAPEIVARLGAYVAGERHNNT